MSGKCSRSSVLDKKSRRWGGGTGRYLTAGMKKRNSARLDLSVRDHLTFMCKNLAVGRSVREKERVREMQDERNAVFLAEGGKPLTPVRFLLKFTRINC